MFIEQFYMIILAFQIVQFFIFLHWEWKSRMELRLLDAGGQAENRCHSGRYALISCELE